MIETELLFIFIVCFFRRREETLKRGPPQDEQKVVTSRIQFVCIKTQLVNLYSLVFGRNKSNLYIILVCVLKIAAIAVR